MKLALVLLACVAGALAYSPRNACEVSEWSDWSRSITEGLSLTTYSLPVSTAVDAGRQRMLINRQHKMKFWKDLQACRKDGSCPAYIQNESEGPAECVDGIAGQYPCLNVDLRSMTSIEDLGYYDKEPFDFYDVANDIWGWTDPENGDEYAIVGTSGGSSFVRINDPTNPEVLAFLYTHSQAIIWRDMKTIGNYVYIVADIPNHGIQVVDMTRFRGLTPDDFAFIEADAHYDGVSNSHNIAGNEEMGLVFAVGLNSICNGGIHVLDVVTDPLNPQFLGCVDQDGYTHDAECIIYNGPDTRYTGRHICFGYNEDTITIIDITDINDIQIISKTGYAGASYVHQGWITDDHTIVISNDELDESNFDENTHSYVWDVTDLTSPILASTYVSSETATDHNLYIKGDYVYMTNYEAGLRILYIDSDTLELQEVAYFDTTPDKTTISFTGTWSSYIYFESGEIIVSSMQHGLFIVRPDYEAIEQTVQQIRAQKTQQVRFRHVINPQSAQMCPALVERQ